MIQTTPLNRESYRLLHEGTLAFARASHNGMRIDVESCKEKMSELGERIDKSMSLLEPTGLWKLWTKIYREKSNVNSDAQLRVILFDKLHYESVGVTESGLPSTDYDSLSSLPDKDIQHLITIRKLSKIRNTYLKGLVREQVNGWIRPNFNLNLAVTYRSSSDHPNFQNMPKRDKEFAQIVRSMFYPREGHQFVSSDFSGVEVRIAACHHKDPVMLKYINDPTTDMHRDMAQQLYCLKKIDKNCLGDKHLRQAAKNGFVFPQFYGDYYGNNAKILIGQYAIGCPPLHDGSNILEHLSNLKLVKLNRDGGVVNYDKFIDHVKDVEHDFWYKRFRVYQEWKDEYYAQYQKNGYLDMFTGFRCSGVMSRNDVLNYPIQGAAFHCLLWSFIEVNRMLERNRADSRLVGQIHDDMILDVNPAEISSTLQNIKLVTCTMLPEHWDWIIVPIEIELSKAGVDEPWANLKEIK